MRVPAMTLLTALALMTMVACGGGTHDATASNGTDNANPPTTPPTAIPPTATPEPLPDWEATGNWYRDSILETVAVDYAASVGIEMTMQAATMDADATSKANEVFLTLACIEGEQVMYLRPYSLTVPRMVDTYVIGVWNRDRDHWIGAPGVYHNPVITDDASAIYIINTRTIRQMVESIQSVHQSEGQNLSVRAGMYHGSTPPRSALWSNFDTRGFEDARAYLGCLR